MHFCRTSHLCKTYFQYDNNLSVNTRPTEYCQLDETVAAQVKSNGLFRTLLCLRKNNWIHVLCFCPFHKRCWRSLIPVWTLWINVDKVWDEKSLPQEIKRSLCMTSCLIYFLLFVKTEIFHLAFYLRACHLCQPASCHLMSHFV